jgi:hypothetical protein
MMNKLYISNLPDSATEDALRAHFAACGGVCQVEIRVDSRGRRSVGLAAVTMTSPTYATRARTQLDGAPFAGQPLHVSDAPISASRTAPPAVMIAQQFRERNNMTYDLSCRGTPLILRVFASEDDRWRVEARATEAPDALIARGYGATRCEALGEALREYNADATGLPKPAVDADAVIEAMRSIRAV